MKAHLIASAVALATVAPASAQYNPQQEQRTLGQRTPRPGGIYARDWREYHRYDVGRLEPGQASYDADRYRRDARFYRPRVLEADDRLYRGSSGRFYCRRADGTTGSIDALGGGAFNGLLAKRGSALVRDLMQPRDDTGFSRLVAHRDVVCR